MRDRAPPLNRGLPGRAWAECALVFLAAAGFYFALHGELPYHEEDRFAIQIESDAFVWDIAHILLQPATLLWHRLLSFGGAAITSQKQIGAFATALGVAVFHATVLRLGVPRFQRICAALLLAGSASVIVLAPSAHMKLVTMPFLNGALYGAVLFELRRRAGVSAGNRALMGSAVLLAVAAAFLASCLAAAPFICLGLFVAEPQRRTGFVRAAGFALMCGGVFLAIACLGFVLISHQPLSVGGLTGSVRDKAAIGPQAMSVTIRLARSVFGTVNNFVYAPAVGSVPRAWMSGDIADLRPYYGVLLREIVPWTLALTVIGAIYLASLRAAWRGTVLVMPLAFLAGAQAWSIYYSLNDPEHWFLATAPTIVLLLTTFPAATRRWLVPAFAGLVFVANMLSVALPTTLYPLSRYDALTTKMFTDKDLVLGFAAYPGGPYIGFFSLNGIALLNLDQMAKGSESPEAFYTAADARIRETLAHGGRVVAFGVFDPENWDAPWPNMARRGVPKAKFLAHFQSAFEIRRLPDIAELKAWEITPR